MNLATDLPAEVFDVIGVAGFGLYVLSYTLLTTHRVTSSSISYFAVNLLAASLVLISLMGAFNLASALIQVFWIAVSILAIAMRWSSRGQLRGRAPQRSG